MGTRENSTEKIRRAQSGEYRRTALLRFSFTSHILNVSSHTSLSFSSQAQKHLNETGIIPAYSGYRKGPALKCEKQP